VGCLVDYIEPPSSAMAWTVDPPMSAEEDHGRIVSAQRQLWRFTVQVHP
jgi:hypothetical protein